MAKSKKTAKEKAQSKSKGILENARTIARKVKAAQLLLLLHQNVRDNPLNLTKKTSSLTAK